MHFKQEERGDRGENVGVIAGLLVCECLCCCRAGGGWLEGSELALSPLSWILTSFFVAVVFLYYIQRYMWVISWLKLVSGWVGGWRGVARRLRDKVSLHAFIELFANR